jgi:hypothetical protein
MMMDQVAVIFRKDRTGWKDCFALFPELPADDFGHYCTAYQHVGQHCAADYRGCIANSDPATPAEYADLFEELEWRGYTMVVRREPHRRCTSDGGGWRSSGS